MHITSIHSETWDLMSRGVEKDTGLPSCHVRRVTCQGDATVWKLVKRTSRNGIEGWYNVGQYIGALKGFRPTPERGGRKLSGSRTDLTLLSFAQEGHGNAYA